MNDNDASSTHEGTTHDTTMHGRNTAKALEALLVIGMVFMVLGMVGAVIDRPGLGLYGDTRPAVDAEVDFPVDFGDRLATTEIDDAIVDAATGQAPVTIGEPVIAHFVFTEPSASQRVIWVIWQVTDPLVALLGTWLVFAIVRSARRGDPFVAKNEQRLWVLAFVVGVGGMLTQLLGGFSEMLMLQRSAASDMTSITATLSFLPAILGLGIAVLAAVWHVGVGLRDDVEGMI